MLFNSFEFLIFFPVVTGVYFGLPHRFRWGWLLAASCIFYMAFIPVYILVLFTTIAIDYLAALKIEKSQEPQKKIWLIGSVISTCVVLFIFKYSLFFSLQWNEIARFFHWNYSLDAFQILLPVGLSFHTFQSLSYVIEVYRGHQKAERHFGIYALYVMFYPQLVAGPIERPQNLLPQFYANHDFDSVRVVSGLRLMLWGLFKKVVIADRLAIFVTKVYDAPQSHDGILLILATVFFAFQIYCDFSGYSDIAIGAARVMGFKLMTNFRQPYAAKSVREFWQRWHISLSTWFRDYLYVPLGGNQVPQGRWIMNILFVFALSGLWHGANWTFVVWGILNGFYWVASVVLKPLRDFCVQRVGLDRAPRIRAFLQRGIVFLLISFSWIFFRAHSLSDAWYIVTHLFQGVEKTADVHFLMRQLGNWTYTGFPPGQMVLALGSLVLLECVHLLERWGWIQVLFRSKWGMIRWGIYYALVLGIIFFKPAHTAQFIYFQF